MKRRVLVIGVCSAFRMAMALAVTSPLAWLWARAVGEHPSGDAIVFGTGGYWLVESARFVRPLVATSVASGGVLLFALSMAWLLFVVTLIAHADDPARDGVDLCMVALERFAPLSILHGVTLAAQVAAIAGAAWLGSRFATEDQSGDFLRMSMVGAGVIIAALMAMGHDAARVHCVQHRPGVWGLISGTFERLRRGGFRLIGAALWRGALAWLALGAALWCSTMLVPGGSVALAGAFAAQGAAVVAYVWLRFSWFRWLHRL
jgi:hypothetical protein